jgi:hypothetical protein
MKKLFALTAAAILSGASAQSAIIFDPANPLNVVDQGGFTGTGSSPGAPYNEARLLFTFSNLNPIPLPSSFQISNISLKGPGISTSLAISPITITGNGNFFTSYVALNSIVPSINFATDNVSVSFDVPAAVINDGASFSIRVTYANQAEFQQATSSAGSPKFDAQAIPEPGTWAAAALLVGGAAFMRWRRRKVA